MKVLSAEQMREVDRLTTSRHSIPSIELMENAAIRVFETLVAEFGDPSGKRFLVFSGRGNNGGDGAAVARLLNTRGNAAVDLVLLGRIEDLKGDARTNFERALRMSAGADSRLKVFETESLSDFPDLSIDSKYDAYVDGLLGTGLTRPAAGLFEEAIRLMNSRPAGLPLVSIDIPSGIASDSPGLIGPAVRADLTITFTAPKIGNILPPASDYNGKLVVAQIGSPQELIDSAGSLVNLVTREMVSHWLEVSRRSSHANKGDAGKVLVVAGSRGKTGAACLAGEAAMRAGAGLVTIAAPSSSQPVIASRAIPECMTESLQETEDGVVAAAAVKRVLALAEVREVLALGPGLGSPEQTRAFVESLLKSVTGPVVIDADGLNALAPLGDEINGTDGRPLILTPHPGEMARLLGATVEDVIDNPVSLAVKMATSHSLFVVLKSSRTLTAAPYGDVYINMTGNAGMATGGSGDVLTGILAGLVAQKPDDLLGAATAAVYLHGVAGDLAAARFGTRAMIASDITACLGDAFVEIGGTAERLVK